ncbi:MAG: glycoside hydrolase family 3 C-terminal domain-containing protein [Alistipes sp.]|nr:glycoside hydrolase family 3 C-terminal domain-containing protein [Alistipes sp.]
MKLRISRLIITAILSVMAYIPCSAQPTFTDASRSNRERAEDIVKHMTLQEKVALMVYNSPAVERLGIRNYNWWNEALHGIARNGNATVFPMPIAMASSFDADLLEQVFTATSDEGRIKWNIARAAKDKDMWYKGLSYWTPNINIFRDPRWGRGMETYGEDPYLTSQLGMAVVRGLQGEHQDGPIKALACAKHYAIHSGPESTRHSFDAVVSERDLWETYLPAFKDLITKADVKQVMFAYNRMFGIPAGANERFMRDILEKEWGFDGVVVSDCWAVKDFYAGHKWSANKIEAVAAAVKAGMDMECGDAVPAIPEAIRRGLLSVESVDESITKVMEYRYLLGEMDGETPWDNLSPDKLCSQEHKDLALKIAHESIVLLENKGILPLQKSEKLLIMGPNADQARMLWGNYNGFPLNESSLLDGIKSKGGNIQHIEGVPYVEGLTTAAVTGDVAMKAAFNPDSKGFDVEKFVAAAKDYKTVIFAGGLASCLEGEQLEVSAPGFDGGDRTTLSLPDVQKRVIKALHDAGKRVILVNFSGSAMAFADEAKWCDAIVQAWYLGQEGGKAIADVLYGDVNPSGKLPLTFYADDSQLADFEDYSMKGRTYRYFEGKPLYPFGHGLSYTTFKFGKARIAETADGSKALVVTVRNTGKRAGEDVVQLYISRADDPEGPIKTLRGFKRVALKAGEQAEVSIPINDDTFLWWNPATGRMNPMEGEYTLHYGDTSDSKSLKTIKYRFKK